MPRIADSLDPFSARVSNREPILFNKKNEWRTVGGIRRFIYKMQWVQNRLLKKTTLQFIKALDDLESQKVYFNNNRAVAQNQRCLSYLSAGQALCNRYDKRCPAELNTLKQRLEGLRFRIEASSGGLDALAPQQVDTQNLQFLQLRQHALEWKKKQMYPLADRRLSVLDVRQLQEVARYATYVPLLLRDAKLRGAFFKWAIRDHIAVAPFIEYPAHHELLHRHYLEPRVAASGGLSIDKLPCHDGGERKVLTQPFRISEHSVKAISILNLAKEVILYGRNHTLKIRDIFKAFKNKNREVGNFEYFGQHEYYNCADPKLNLDDPELLTKMKTVRTYTKQELQTAFNIPNLLDGQTVKLYRATRSSNKLTVEGCHAWVWIALPQQDGTYQIKSCGVLAATYPKTWWQTLAFLGKTVFGRLYTPDDNDVMITRQHCAVPVVLTTPVEVNELQEQVRSLFKESRDGRLIFQLGGDDNCAGKVQRLFMSKRERQPDASGKVRNLFHVKFIKTTPMEPLGTLFRFFRRCPVPVQRIFIKCLELIFGGYSKLKVRDANGKFRYHSLSRSPFHKNHRVYTPTLIFKKVEKSPGLGVVWYGPDPLRSRVDVVGAA